MIGTAVILTRQIVLRSGETHEPGGLYRVSSTWRGKFDLTSILPNGRAKRQPNGCPAYMRGISRSAFEIADDVPEDPGYEV